MLNNNDRIEPGTLKLQSYSRPPLVAGDYLVNSHLYVDGKKADGTVAIPADTAFENSNLKFTVTAPRFALELSLITSVYPLPGSTGPYHATLPHIVFSRKTLPWERRIGYSVAQNEPEKQWMALLLLTADEIKQYSVGVKEVDVEKVNDNQGDNTLTVPDITLDAWEKDKSKIKVLELPLALFKSIAPLKQELDCLAHTRQMDMSNKENTYANPKGWFSAIIANRLPAPGEDNSVFLVSLEGHENNIPQDTAESTVTGSIRLVLLHQWTFTDRGATFAMLIDKLESNTTLFRIQLDDDVKKQLPAPTANALRYGYMPINLKRRNGSKDVAWYRGPLVPVAVSNPEQYSYKNADQALRFDSGKTTTDEVTGSGMFDVSYSVAWQLGRLLALQTPGFFKAINDWKNDFKRNQPLETAKKILQTEPTLQINPDDLGAMICDAESDETLSDYLIELWNMISTTKNT